jgi:hypothetical protein
MYCGEILEPDGRWDLAHVEDGRPELGRAPACPRCNQRARRDRRG